MIACALATGSACLFAQLRGHDIEVRLPAQSMQAHREMDFTSTSQEFFWETCALLSSNKLIADIMQLLVNLHFAVT